MNASHPALQMKSPKNCSTTEPAPSCLKCEAAQMLCDPREEPIDGTDQWKAPPSCKKYRKFCAGNCAKADPDEFNRTDMRVCGHCGIPQNEQNFEGDFDLLFSDEDEQASNMHDPERLILPLSWNVKNTQVQAAAQEQTQAQARAQALQQQAAARKAAPAQGWWTDSRWVLENLSEQAATEMSATKKRKKTTECSIEAGRNNKSCRR